jgi:RNA polymerase sigma factor (TIGR02999 family)
MKWDSSPRLFRSYMAQSPGGITQLLMAWQAGDETAREQVFSLFYEPLRQLARQQRRNWSGSNTLNATALVHELYEKLSKQNLIVVKDRAHFTLIAAKALRHILINYAKSKQRKRRGGDWVRVTLDTYIEESSIMTQEVDEILAIHEALFDLAQLNERLVQVVEMHFFAGLTYDEIAATLGVTKRTVTRDWAKAKIWLRRALQEQPIYTCETSDPEGEMR